MSIYNNSCSTAGANWKHLLGKYWTNVHGNLIRSIYWSIAHDNTHQLLSTVHATSASSCTQLMPIHINNVLEHSSCQPTAINPSCLQLMPTLGNYPYWSTAHANLRQLPLLALSLCRPTATTYWSTSHANQQQLLVHSSCQSTTSTTVLQPCQPTATTGPQRMPNHSITGPKPVSIHSNFWFTAHTT
jgi:hypothetical protein